MQSQQHTSDTPDSRSFTDAKTILAFPFAAIAWFTLVPIINVYFDYPAILIAVPLSVVPLALFMRGAAILWSPELSPARPHAARLGTVAALVYLTAAPHSLQLALMNRETRPYWLLMSLAGIVASVAFLCIAFYRWRKTRPAT
jgi:EamA domain-containing membrane protein RarD